MSVSPIYGSKSRWMKVLGYLGAVLGGACVAAPVYADGMSDPDKAHALCEKWGQADTPANLKKCCSNVILVESLKEQKKLEAQCAGSDSTNKAGKPVSKGS